MIYITKERFNTYTTEMKYRYIIELLLSITDQTKDNVTTNIIELIDIDDIELVSIFVTSQSIVFGKLNSIIGTSFRKFLNDKRIIGFTHTYMNYLRSNPNFHPNFRNEELETIFNNYYSDIVYTTIKVEKEMNRHNFLCKYSEFRFTDENIFECPNCKLHLKNFSIIDGKGNNFLSYVCGTSFITKNNIIVSGNGNSFCNYWMHNKNDIPKQKNALKRKGLIDV